MATDVILLDCISTLVIPVSKAAFPIIERQPIECSPRFEVVDITLKINAILLIQLSSGLWCMSSAKQATFDDNTALGRSFTFGRKTTGLRIES
jgi:hypothetical protein